MKSTRWFDRIVRRLIESPGQIPSRRPKLIRPGNFRLSIDPSSKSEVETAVTTDDYQASSRLDYPDLDDETLAQVADELWQIYDADEAANGHPTY